MRVNEIITQLRDANVDLADVHTMLSNTMNGYTARYDRTAESVLDRHFPNFVMLGVSDHEPLAIALREALAQQAENISAGQEPHRPEVQSRASGSAAPEPSRPSLAVPPAAPHRFPVPNSALRVNEIITQLRDANVDLADVHTMLSNMMNGYATRYDRTAVSVLDRHFPNFVMLGVSDHEPLAIALREALAQFAPSSSRAEPPSGAIRDILRRAPMFSRGTGMSVRNTAGGASSGDAPPAARATIPRDAPRARGVAQQGALPRDTVRRREEVRPRLVIPRRGNAESNVQFAWRIRTQNPAASTEDILSAVVPERGNRQALEAALQQYIQNYNNICAAFDELRVISKADAEAMGFKDAEDCQGESDRDQATACLFGEDLSLSNPNQQVIGLAQVASSTPQAYQADVNKDLVFMDMKKLAEYLVSKPKHPMNNMPLTVDNIRNFAFKIG